MGEIPLAKWVFDALASHGWKKRAETLTDPNVWVKDGIKLSIYPARTRGNFQVSYLKTNVHWNKLMDTTELSQLIER
jgi:hypothetical protein